MGQMRNVIMLGTDADTGLLRTEDGDWFDDIPFDPTEAYEGNPVIVGFLVAGGENEEIDAVAVDDICNRYAEQLAAARDKWGAFAAWAQENEVTMPEPRMWITAIEVA